MQCPAQEIIIRLLLVSVKQTMNTGYEKDHGYRDKIAHPAATAHDNSAVAGSAITVFDELMSCMRRTELPPADVFHLSAPIASQVAIMREKYSMVYDNVLVGIRNMQSAWSLLAAASSPCDSPPEAVNMGALKAKICDLELQLAAASITVDPIFSDAHFQKLSDAAVSSLKRQNKEFMSGVFIRHTKPIGFSARALVTALHAFDPSTFPAEVSDGDAAKKLKEFDSNNKKYCNFTDFCSVCKLPSDTEAEASPARDVFLRLADVKGLTAETLIDALKEADAPLMSSSEGRSPEQIFRRADSNLRGYVDFAEFDPASPPIPYSLPQKLISFLFNCRIGYTLVSGSCALLRCPMT
jgi:Ca2+-binding EF-hand superfamily protein